jgi:hypothetical protein
LNQAVNRLLGYSAVETVCSSIASTSPAGAFGNNDRGKWRRNGR